MIGAAVNAGRRAAEARMTDAGRALRQDGTTPGPNGTEDPNYVEQFTAPCRIAGQGGRTSPVSRTVTIGGVEREVIEGGLHLPVSADILVPGWIWEVTAVGEGSDPALVGKQYRVERLAVQSHATAHRYDVVEL